MGGGEGAKTNLKNEEGEQSGGLEPDPRYIRCCSAVCRPGYALRDALLGLLVLLGLSVVVTVIFVVCFYVVPDEKQLIDEGILHGNAAGVIGELADINEITLSEGDEYSLPPHHLEEHSQDFSIFTTPFVNYDDTTEESIPAEIPGGFGGDHDTLHDNWPTGDQSVGLEGRENVDGFLPEHNDLQQNQQEHQEVNQFNANRREDQHNLGHAGERPELGSEHGQFQREVQSATTDSRVLLLTEPSMSNKLEMEPECNPVQLPMCVSSVPWTLASRPNWLNHSSDGEMFAALPYVRSSLLDSGCSSLAPLFACSVLEPPCTESGVLPPCRSFCAEVGRTCRSYVQRASLPGLFECNRYPESADPSICVSATQECSGDDDFRCETTGLCVPSSWLCDGADDCRDNSDEQNCPLSPTDRRPTSFIDTANTANNRRTTFPDTEYSETKTRGSEYDEEYSGHPSAEKTPFPEDDAPPFAYDEFHLNNPGTFNDPALAGPNLNDPALIEEAYPNENENSEISESIPSEFSDALTHDLEKSISENRFTAKATKTNLRPQSNNEEENIANNDDIQHPVLQSARPHSPSDDYEEENIKDQFTDYSIRSDHFQNHPIPDVDYPAKETFSVDSTSSVNENYHRVHNNKNEDGDKNSNNEAAIESSRDDVNRYESQNDPISHPVIQNKTPSQRLRERLTANNRRRKRPDVQRPNSNLQPSEKADVQTETVIQSSTRPPSRLANFQQRFREWRDRRRPTLPTEYENLRKSQSSPTRSTSSNRPYDLIRRRPQRVTTPTPETFETKELLRDPLPTKPENNENNINIEMSNIRQPITLPKSVLPSDVSDITISHEYEDAQVPLRNNRPFNRIRTGVRHRQQQRHRNDQQIDTQRPAQSRRQEHEPNLQTVNRDVHERVSNRQPIAVEIPIGDVPDQPKNDRFSERPEYEEIVAHERPEYEEIVAHDQPERELYAPHSNDRIPERELYNNPADQNNFPAGESHVEQEELQISEHESYQPIESDDIPQSYNSQYTDGPQRSELYDEANVDYSIPDFNEQIHETNPESINEHNERRHYNNFEESHIRPDSEDEPYRPPEYRPNTQIYEEQDTKESHPITSHQESFQHPQFQRREYAEISQSESESEPINLPNDFRVSFPPPRPNQFRENRPYHPPTGSSFYSREDAIVSDLHYDVPAVSQHYPIYQNPPSRSSDSFVSPYGRQRPS